MSPSIVANPIINLTRAVEAKKLTGCISIENNVPGQARYGLIQFLKGERIACDFAGQKGDAAFHQMLNLEAPVVSFAKGTVLLKRQDG